MYFLYHIPLSRSLCNQALGAGIGVASSYLPGVNIPIGENASLSLSPSIAFGGGGFQLGASAGLSLPWMGGFSVGLGGGASWGKDGFTGNRGWKSSFTGAIGYNDGTNSFSLSTTQFNSPGLRSQTLGTFSYRHKSGFGVGYSNDGAPFDKFSFADPGSDGFRSAALQLSYKELTIGTRIFTGERDMLKDDDTAVSGYPRGVVGNEDAYAYMSSPLFLSYKSMRAGVDDWRIGHAVQNIVAHGILKPQVWFRWRDHGQNMQLCGGYVATNNPFYTMVVRAIIIILVISGCYSIQSCALLGVFPRERLLIEKRDPAHDIQRLGLKVNGVYIGQHSDGARAYFVLFNDGICYLNRRTTVSLDTLLYSTSIHDKVRFSSNDSPIGWGLYNIRNNKIDMAFWSVVQSSIEYNQVKWSGEIKDDKTIVIGEGWGISDMTIFNFYPLRDKPDSTNRFIK